MPAPSYALTNYAGTTDPAGDILALIEVRLADAGWEFVEQASFTQSALARYMRVWKCPGTLNTSTVDFYIGLVKNQAAGTYLAARVFEGYNSTTHTIQRPCLKGDQAQAPYGTAWTPRTLPASLGHNIVFANGIFLVTATASVSNYVSLDGINWTTKVYPSSSNWKKACYGNGIWVAVSASTNVAASTPDPINTSWTARTLPSSMNANALAYGNPGSNPIFVCLSATAAGTVGAYSTDGISWTASTLPSPGAGVSWSNVAYGNGVFIAVANTAVTTVAARSTDGITWSSITMPSSAIWNDVVYAEGTWVAVGTGVVAYSTNDGVTWQLGSMPVAAGTCIAYGNGLFVAATGTVMAYSLNGIDWVTGLSSTNSVTSLAYGAGLFVGIRVGSYNLTSLNPMDLTLAAHAGVQDWALDGSTIPAMVDTQTITNLVNSTNYDVGILVSKSYLVIGVNTAGTATQVFQWILGLFQPIYTDDQAVYPPLMAVGDPRTAAPASNGVSRAPRVTYSANAFAAYMGPESVMIGMFVGAAYDPASMSIRGSRVVVAGYNSSFGWSLANGGTFHGWLLDCVAVFTGGSAAVLKIGDSVTIGGVTMVALGQSASTASFAIQGSCGFFFDVTAGS